MVLALAFALVAGAIAVKTATQAAPLTGNVHPVAEAGPDQAVQSISEVVHTGGFPNVTLDGSASFDADGSIVAYTWLQYNHLPTFIPEWQPNHTYAAGSAVVPAAPTLDNTLFYYTVAGGISSNGQPAWPTSGNVTDNTITWMCMGAYTDYTPANNWPALHNSTGVTITEDGSAPDSMFTPGAVVHITTAGLYVFELVVTDNTGTSHGADFVVVVAGNTWFVDQHGTDVAGNGLVPGTSAFRTITYAISHCTSGTITDYAKNGDRIICGPNNSSGGPDSDTFLHSGFGGNTAYNEQIVVDKWLTIWSQNGRDDKGTLNSEFATTIAVQDQEGAGSYHVAQVVSITWPYGVTDPTITDGINAEKCGVVFGGTNPAHGFDLMGAPIGIYCVGANAVDIQGNRILQFTSEDGSSFNFIGIELDGCKVPTVDDNIIICNMSHSGDAFVGIELNDCDESLPNVYWYNVSFLSGTAVGTLNGPLGTGLGGAQVLKNSITAICQNIDNGIILTDCPKAWVFDNFVQVSVKESNNVSSVGIGLYGVNDTDGCDWSWVDSNNGVSFTKTHGVIVNVDGNITAIGEGIYVDNCQNVRVTNNDVYVTNTGESPCSLGGMLGIGIGMDTAAGSTVTGNAVDVNNKVSNLKDELGQVLLADSGKGILSLDSVEIDALQGAFNDIFSDNYSPSVQYAASLAMGIYAYDSDAIHIGSVGAPANTIDVCSWVSLQVANFDDDFDGSGAGASLAQGITVLCSDAAVVAMNQIVSVDPVTDADADTVGVHAYLQFLVTVTTPSTPAPTPSGEGLPEGTGKAGAIGILTYNASILGAFKTPVMVLYNTMDVLGQADVQLSGAEIEILTSFPDSVLGQIDFAIADMMANAAEIAALPAVDLYGLCIPPFGGVGTLGDGFDPDSFVKAQGLVFGIGIATLRCDAAYIQGNTVEQAVSELNGSVISETSIPSLLLEGDAVVASSQYNLSFAVGILNYKCGFYFYGNAIPTTICKNVVEALATSDITIEAAQIVPNQSSGLNDVEAHGSGMSVASGILVIGLENEFDQSLLSDHQERPICGDPDAIVTNNSASGDAEITLDTNGYNLVDEKLAEADGNALGLGGGIVVIGQMFPLISGNGDPTGLYKPGDNLSDEENFVWGWAEAHATTDAVGLSQEDPDATGNAVALGVGIAAVFCLYPTIEKNCNFHQQTYNTSGSVDNSNENGSEATGYNPEDTFVFGDAEADGYVTSLNQAILVGGQETYATSNNLASGVGILVAGCEGANVNHNHAEGSSSVTVDTLAVDEDPLEMVAATSLGTSIACGIALCDLRVQISSVELHLPYDISQSNTFEAGAYIDIVRATAIGDPLSTKLGLAAGIDAFMVFDTDVNAGSLEDSPTPTPETFDIQPVEFNYNDMPGTEPSSAAGLGTFFVDIGLFVVNMNDPYMDLTRDPYDVDLLLIDARYNYWGDFRLYSTPWTANTQYEVGDLVRPTANMGLVYTCTAAGISGTSAPDWPVFPALPGMPTSVTETGGPTWTIVNWDWNPGVFDQDNAALMNLTGPGGDGYGLGQPIYVVADCWTTWVQFQPWLTINHEWCLDSHVGKFGKAIELNKCWNTFSVPIALDDISFNDLYTEDDPNTSLNEMTLNVRYATWAGFKELNSAFTSAIGPAVKWDAQTGKWVILHGYQALDPLMGFKVYVKSHTYVFILASTADTMPTLPVYKGWNLVGPNPPFCDPGLWSDDFVSSIVRSSGIDGFAQLVSQGSQHNWSYTFGDWVQGWGEQFLETGKAYRVFMNGQQTLAGFGFTRLPLYPEHHVHF